jgi:hypothetical protein
MTRCQVISTSADQIRRPWSGRPARVLVEQPPHRGVVEQVPSA